MRLRGPGRPRVGADAAGKAPRAPQLRPDSGRRGPKDLWAAFDTAFEDLGSALEGISLPAIGRAFGELATISRGLSIAVAEGDAAAARRAEGG